MRVAVYHPWIYLKSGLERTLLEWARRSRHEITLYSSHYDAEGTYPELKQIGVRELSPVSVKRQYGAVISAGLSIARERIDPASYDVLTVSCDGLGDLLTFGNRRKPIVNLCFTPLRAVYDEHYRARHLARLGWKKPIGLGIELAWRIVDRLAWRNYARVVCISEEVKRRVLRARLCPPERLYIAYPGIPGDRIVGQTPSKPFFFLPGRIMWTKNIELGIAAFLRFRATNAELAAPYRLVIAGMVDEKSRRYHAKLQELAGTGNNIEFIIGPSDEAMQALYRDCACLLFTAFNEDWGLTPIEAMCYGKPVISVDSGGQKEIVVDGETGFRLEDDPSAYAEAMRQLAADPALAQRMGAAGLKRAPMFTWETFVQQMDDHMDAVARPR
ncbi:MAG: glycosyltransferase family 4 protein [Alphaproteobacteria bacterium]|nr:glycosyltransferase family 4 protein [Alphaproteobacteria bacterium]